MNIDKNSNFYEKKNENKCIEELIENKYRCNLLLSSNRIQIKKTQTM